MFASIASTSDDEGGWEEVKKPAKAVRSVEEPVIKHIGSPAPYVTDTAIETGAWTLYYHSFSEDSWNKITNYIKIATIHTYGEFWAIIDALSDESLINGYFFMMRDPFPPIWELKENVRGGTYSIKTDRNYSANIYLRYLIAAMLGKISKVSANKITGVCISPKKKHNIITIWNEKTRVEDTRGQIAIFNEPSDIHILSPTISLGDIRYLANCDKNFDKHNFEKR
jgi:hypothetical protein